MLTKQQRKLLFFIDKQLKSTGIIPSYQEMQEAVNLQSKSGIFRLIKGLEERGFIARIPNRARAIEILKIPPVINDTTEKSISDINNNVRALPLYGKIAAGVPIEALVDENKTIDVPSFITGKGNYYVLEIEGDSMIDAGICDGDYAVIRETNIANDGEIVVALIDQCEATLKYLYMEDDSIILKPANENYEDRIVKKGSVQIQGKLAGILRKY